MNLAEKLIFGTLGVAVVTWALATAWWFFVQFVRYINDHKDA